MFTIKSMEITLPNYIIYYDIASPRRLQKIYRHLSGIAIRVQYSIFHLQASKVEIEQLVVKLEQMVTAEDDLRIYSTQALKKIKRLGKSEFPDGILLD